MQESSPVEDFLHVSKEEKWGESKIKKGGKKCCTTKKPNNYLKAGGGRWRSPLFSLGAWSWFKELQCIQVPATTKKSIPKGTVLENTKLNESLLFPWAKMHVSLLSQVSTVVLGSCSSLFLSYDFEIIFKTIHKPLFPF